MFHHYPSMHIPQIYFFFVAAQRFLHTFSLHSVLVWAGTELIFFKIAPVVLCFEFVMKNSADYTLTF